MQNSIISQQELRKSNTEQQSSSYPSSRRRSSLWDRVAQGFSNASKADVAGAKKGDAQGFAPIGAKIDESFGSSALWETTLSGPSHNPDKQRERNVLGEDALRQMS